MVYCVYSHGYTVPTCVVTWIQKNSGYELVPSLACLLRIPRYLHPLSMPQPSKMGKSLSASIIIPSLNRPESLKRVLSSLEAQTVKPMECIVLTEEGPLARIRNEGAKKAKGEVIVFIDDDVFCSPEWLEGILQPFNRPNIGGVSGRAVITTRYRRQRDLFRFPKIKGLYDRIFLEGREHDPGRITKAGTWTTGASEEGCDYEGSVDYLEACNMAFRRTLFEQAGGFDETYGCIGDWSEPDLSFRIRKLGYVLWFSKLAKLYHEPSRTGAYLKRDACQARLSNYLLFSRRWVKPHWRHSLYKMFLWTYYSFKRRNKWLSTR